MDFRNLRRGALRAGLAVIATAAIVVAGCGGSDDSGSSAEAASAGAPYEITYGEFIADLEPEKKEVLKAYVADHPDCNAEVDYDFLLIVSAKVTDYDPETPLSDVLEEMGC